MVNKVLILFGSDSDKPVYDEICKTLKEEKVPYDMVVCSAHRTPDLLDALLKKDDFSLVIAGAGVAAHLPGVVAAKTIKPVIGVPCNGCFQGLDALLSIIQMPPGIPVLSVGVDEGKTAGQAAIQILAGQKSVTVIGDKKNKRVLACVELLQKLGVPHKFSDSVEENTVNIQFLEFEDIIEDYEEFVINVPLKDDTKAEDALTLWKNTEYGVWVGVNRGDNAAIAAVEILNISGKYTKALLNYRKEMAQKILSLRKK
ncbi:AIR carboxylase family protein [Candidatus Woesearchaeota archaeon]|nr:AIR carboxylase family protein [Candidatus Woesearchaeota archaeon]